MQPGRSYQVLLPDLQQVVDAAQAQQAAAVRAVAGLPNSAAQNIQQAAALQQLAQQQQAASFAPQLAAAAAANAAGAPAGIGYPELTLFSQFSQLLQPNAAADLSQLPGLNLEALRDSVSRGIATAAAANAGANNRSGRTESKSSSAYASRHQAAEQRRRTRINERLERLRKIVPHAERANTATFLEEVVKYIEKLQAQVAELTGQPQHPTVGLPATTASQQPSFAGGPTATVGTGLTFRSEPAATNGPEGCETQDVAAAKATADSMPAPQERRSPEVKSPERAGST